MKSEVTRNTKQIKACCSLLTPHHTTRTKGKTLLLPLMFSPVILVTPPRVAAAPIMAYSPGVTHDSLGEQNNWKNSLSLNVLQNMDARGSGA